MKYIEAVSTAITYITEDAVETCHDAFSFLEHGFHLALLAGMTWGNFLLMPVTALLWAREIQRDPAGAAEMQRIKNARDD